MKNITTTELRTKSKQLVLALNDGQVVELIHRSSVVGEIKPKKKSLKTLTPERIKKLNKIIEELNLPQTTEKEREQNYRDHIERKYGKGIS